MFKYLYIIGFVIGLIIPACPRGYQQPHQICSVNHIVSNKSSSIEKLINPRFQNVRLQKTNL